eukprot:g6149.t1
MGQHLYPEAVEYFQGAIATDPHSIVLHRNLAWLQHAVTVDSDAVKSVYRNVWKLNWLRLVVRSALAGRVFEYTELRKQILPYLNIRSFEESKIADSVSIINGTILHSKNNDVLVIAGRTWDIQFLHTGHGSVTLSITSDDCVLRNHADHNCQLFFQDLLEIRPKLLSVFEVGIGGGHFLEAGVWRGGMTIWIKAVLNAMLDVYAGGNGFDFKVYVADSFGGVPPPRNSSSFSQDQWHHMPKNLYKVQLQHVVENFAKYFLFAPPEASGDENTIFMSEELQFLPGYFNESFVGFDAPLSLLRIDADSYESILDVLDHLYDNVVPGGIIMIDDWHLNGARRAVLEFRLKRGILEPMIPVPEDSVYACEERNPYLFHSFPNKPIQGMFFVKRPNNEQSSAAKQYYAPFQTEVGIELGY